MQSQIVSQQAEGLKNIENKVDDKVAPEKVAAIVDDVVQKRM